jgi:hypothetical protein
MKQKWVLLGVVVSFFLFPAMGTAQQLTSMERLGDSNRAGAQRACPFQQSIER